MHGALDKLKSLLKLEWRGTLRRIFVTVATPAAAAVLNPVETAAAAAYTGNCYT
jgi:hypothetical protein